MKQITDMYISIFKGDVFRLNVRVFISGPFFIYIVFLQTVSTIQAKCFKQGHFENEVLT